MLQLSNLEKLTKKRIRRGRGGCRGGYSGRGSKGQKARSGAGGELKACFEGGQMPLARRIPRRGFVNSFAQEVAILNLRDLDTRFNAGDVVTNEALVAQGLIKRSQQVKVKVLGNGTLSKSLTVHADAFSETAKSAIEKAGGKVQLANS